MNPATRTLCVLLALLGAGNASVAGPPAPDGADLAAAREALQVQEAAWRRLHEEFERLLAERRLSSAEAADYHAFLDELSERVRAERRRVARLASLPDAGAGQPAQALPAGFDRGRTTGERVDALDAELGASLSAFDDKLLREQQAMAAKSRPAGDSGTGSAAAGERAGESSGGESGAGAEAAEQSAQKSGSEGRGDGDDATAAAGGQAGGDASAGGPPTGGDIAGRGDGDGEGEQVATAGGGDSPARNDRVPDDVGSGEDDDIVARQIREAAERETDPALREKLWEEYRRYKGRGAERAAPASR